MKRARAKARDWSLDIFRGCAKDSPPWRRRGGRAIENCSRSFERRGRGGWFKQPLIFWNNTTPSAPSKMASQHFICGRSHPSSAEEGNSDSRFASTTSPRTKLEVEGIDAIAIDQEFPKMSKLQSRAKARVRIRQIKSELFRRPEIQTDPRLFLICPLCVHR